MEKISTAIVIFCFNRVDKLSQLLESLANCKEVVTLPLYFYIDSARFKDEESAVDATAAVAEAFQHPMKTIFRRETNLGLKVSLTEGISEMLVRHDAVIVLEDDLVLGPFALDYFMRGLEKYVDSPKVVSICGYAIGKSDQCSSNEALFLPMTNSWGWATWRDRWQAHRAGEAAIASTQSASFRTAMNVFGLRNYSDMFRQSEDGLINSWWINWQLNAINRHSVSLFPRKSHVSNGGFRGGTHASRWNLFINALPVKPLAEAPTNFPSEVLVDFRALDRIIASREALILRITGFLGQLKRRIRRVFR